MKEENEDVDHEEEETSSREKEEESSKKQQQQQMAYEEEERRGYDGQAEAMDGLSAEERQVLEIENDRLYEDLVSVKDAVQQVETKVVRITELQEVFAEKVMQQSGEIELIGNYQVSPIFKYLSGACVNFNIMGKRIIFLTSNVSIGAHRLTHTCVKCVNLTGQ